MRQPRCFLGTGFIFSERVRRRREAASATPRANYLKLMSAYLFRPPGGGRNADAEESCPRGINYGLSKSFMRDVRPPGLPADGGVVSAGYKLWHITKLYARCMSAGSHPAAWRGEKPNSLRNLFVKAAASENPQSRAVSETDNPSSVSIPYAFSIRSRNRYL